LKKKKVYTLEKAIKHKNSVRMSVAIESREKHLFASPWGDDEKGARKNPSDEKGRS